MGTFCTALCIKSHRVRLTTTGKATMAQAKVAVNVYENNRQWKWKHVRRGFKVWIETLDWRQKTYNNAEKVREVSCSPLATGPSLEEVLETLTLTRHQDTKKTVCFRAFYLQCIMEYWDSWMIGAAICEEKQLNLDDKCLAILETMLKDKQLHCL